MDGIAPRECDIRCCRLDVSTLKMLSIVTREAERSR